eukprot:1189945-Prorocentrum_minimum.AAC.2
MTITINARRIMRENIFSLPFCNWCPQQEFSLSPSAIGARYGYTLSPSAIGAPSRSSRRRNELNRQPLLPSLTPPLFLPLDPTGATGEGGQVPGRARQEGGVQDEEVRLRRGSPAPSL